MTRRTTTRPEVRVGGFWLSTIAPQGWGELKHTTRSNGSWQASWSIPIVRDWRHPALVYGAKVDLFLGPICIWTGTLDEPNWDAGEFVAIGVGRDAEDAVALDPAGNASTKPNEVIDAAIARGVLSWTRVGSFGTTPVGQKSDTDGLVTIQSVLDAWAQENNSRWLVNESRQLVIAPVDETKPTWFVVPGSGVLGSAADERVDRLFVRYIDSTTGRRETASYPSSTPAGGVERSVMSIGRGPKTPAQAAAIARTEWDKLQGRSGWTNGLTLTRGQVTTPGGTVADLALVKAGDTLRLLGVPDARGLAQNTDIVIEDTDYDWTDDELQANPVGLAARDEESVLEQVGNLAVDAISRAGGNSADTDWINLTSALTSGVARYRVRGGNVTVQIDGALTTVSGTTATVVTAANSVPAALRPSVNVRTGGYFGGFPGTISMGSAGDITAVHQSGANRGSVSGVLMYPMEL